MWKRAPLPAFHRFLTQRQQFNSLSQQPLWIRHHPSTFAPRQGEAPTNGGGTWDIRLPETGSQSLHGWWWKHPRVRQAAVQHPIVAPTSPKELVLLLVRLSLHFPRLPYAQLLRLHDEFSKYQSSHSFNLLLDLVCLQKRPTYFIRTLNLVERHGLGNELTARLHIRHLVGQGRWDLAFELAKANSPSGEICHEHLLELMANSRKQGPPILDPPWADLITSIVSGSHNNSSLPPATARGIVKYLKGKNRHIDAYEFTKQYISALPQQPTPVQAQLARSLIHENLLLPSSIDRVAKTPGLTHSSLLRQILSLLTLHPSVQPNARTLELSLEWLRRKKERGSRAVKMLKEWRLRWGRDIEDSTVRRKIVALALSSGNTKVAHSLVREELAARRLSLASLPDGQETSSTGDQDPVVRLSRSNGRDDFLWKRLMNSLKDREGRVRRQASKDSNDVFPKDTRPETQL